MSRESGVYATLIAFCTLLPPTSSFEIQRYCIAQGDTVLVVGFNSTLCRTPLKTIESDGSAWWAADGSAQARQPVDPDLASRLSRFLIPVRDQYRLRTWALAALPPCLQDEPRTHVPFKR